MTPTSRSRLLDALQQGKTLGGAARAAGVLTEAVRREMAADDDLAEAVEAAQAAGAVKRSGIAVAVAERKPLPPEQLVDALHDPVTPSSGKLITAKAIGAPAAALAPVQPDPQPTTIAAYPVTSTERHAEFVAECAKLGPGLYGALLWVEFKCILSGMHPMDPMWLWHFKEFYASGKIVDVGRFGLRAAKSVSVPRALIAEILYTARHLEPGQVGVCPIMSKDQGDAADRFATMRAVLSACGFADCTSLRSAEEESGFVCSGGGSQKLKIMMRDLEGHPIEVRVYTASIAGASGFTAIAGFCDEVDLWGKDGGANPCKRVVEILLTRFTTQPGSKLHIMSATYNPESEHARMIEEGDTPLQRVARLGEDGARGDTEKRAAFAKEIKSEDPRLLATGDPESTDIPSWVSNPVSPISTCYALSKGDLKLMFALYGARVAEVIKGRGALTLDDIRAFGPGGSVNSTMNAAGAASAPTIDGLPAMGGGGLIRNANAETHSLQDPRHPEFGSGWGSGGVF